MFLDRLTRRAEMEFNCLYKAIKKEDIEKQTTDVYFLAGVVDTSKRNKDEDIIEKNYFVCDFDIRSYFKEKHWYIVSNEEIKEKAKELKGMLDKSDMFNTRSAIVFTGNGLHLYYIWDFIDVNKDLYSHWVEYIYNKISDTLWWNEFTPDVACRNIGRILRMPWTFNYKMIDKYSMEPAKCEILYERDINSPLVWWINKYWKIAKEAKIKEYTEKAKKYYSKANIQTIEDINSKIDIRYLVCRDYWIEVAKDGKNFKWVKKWYEWMFVVDNVLINYWSHYLSWAKKKWYTPFSYIKERNNLTAAETFKWFKDNFNISQG